jgi:hypothetical protein
MVAASGLFLLCLTASSYHCRHGHADDVRRQVTPWFGVKSSSLCRSSSPRREEWKKSLLSAQSAGIEGQIDDGVKTLRLGILSQLQWEDKCLLLKQFNVREGHCSVPRLHTEDGVNLGRWASHQRQLKKKEKLDPDRKKRLEAIFFEWVFVLPSAPWDKTLALLQQFKKREGHCNVPQSHKEDQANLGIWVNDQRQLKKKEKLDPEREKRLEEIGFEWVLPSATWDKMFALLRQYKRREGHCIVPQSHKEDGANLGTWVTAQRHLEKSGKLVPDRQQLLDDFGFKWARQPKAP